MRKVLVVVDYQNDFVDGSLGFNQSESIAGNIYALVAKAVKNGDLVVFTKDTHYEDYLSTREGIFLPVEHCIKGTKGHQLYGELKVFDLPEKCFVGENLEEIKQNEKKMYDIAIKMAKTDEQRKNIQKDYEARANFVKEMSKESQVERK